MNRATTRLFPSLALTAVLLAGLFLTWPGAASFADTIYLKNGSAIDGTVLGTHEGKVILRIGNVGQTAIDEKEIENIEKNDRTGYVDPGRSAKKEDRIQRKEEDEAPVADDLAPRKVDEKEDIDPELEKEIENLAYQLTRHRTVNRVRAERSLTAMGEVVVPYVLPLTRHPFVRTRVAAYRILKKHGNDEKDVVEACLNGLEDDDRFVRQLAWQAIKRISGKKYAFPWDDETATDRQRARALRRWTEWWGRELEERKHAEEEAQLANEAPKSS